MPDFFPNIQGQFPNIQGQFSDDCITMATSCDIGEAQLGCGCIPVQRERTHLGEEPAVNQNRPASTAIIDRPRSHVPCFGTDYGETKIMAVRDKTYDSADVDSTEVDVHGCGFTYSCNRFRSGSEPLPELHRGSSWSQELTFLVLSCEDATAAAAGTQANTHASAADVHTIRPVAAQVLVNEATEYTNMTTTGAHPQGCEGSIPSQTDSILSVAEGMLKLPASVEANDPTYGGHTSSPPVHVSVAEREAFMISNSSCSVIQKSPRWACKCAFRVPLSMLQGGFAPGSSM